MQEKKTIKETLITPVSHEADVLVAGAGTSGIFAAIAAARNGAKTILVERGSFPGGALFCGGMKWLSFFNSYLAHDGTPKKQCVGGIAQEMTDRMRREGYSPGHVEEQISTGHESIGTVVDRTLLQKVLFDMIRDENILLLLDTKIAGALKEDDRLTGVIIENKSGRAVILASCIVDCTGDADVVAYAGGEFEDLSTRHGIGMLFGMQNADLVKAVDYARTNDLLSHLGTGDKGSGYDRIIWAAIDLYKHPAFADFMQTNGIWGPYISSTHENEASYINGLTSSVSREKNDNPAFQKDKVKGNVLRDISGLNAEQISRCKSIMMERMFQWAGLMQRHLPGFEHAYINWIAPDLGIRSTRSVLCEHQLTADDIKNCVIPEDSIGIFGGNDADFYGSTIKGGGWFGLPYRMLLPKKLDNLLVAGRLITRDWTAHMSTRLVASCFIQGEAAGVAAAMCAENSIRPRDLDVKEFRKRLSASGVILE